MIKSSVTHKIDVPHEPGQWSEFKELGWRSLEIAREAKAREAMLSFRDLGPEFLASVTENAEKKAEKPSEAPEDNYDMSILLRASIVSWSYEESCSEANIDELDKQTADWAFQEILKIHFPSEEALGKVS